MYNAISRGAMGSSGAGVRVSAVLMLGLATTSCTTWVKPGASEYELQATTARCEAASQLQAPPEMHSVTISPAREYPTTPYCNTDSQGRQTCTKPPRDYRPAVYSERDANETVRRAIVRDCMFSFGWRPE